jgi:hypothetical protein
MGAAVSAGAFIAGRIAHATRLQAERDCSIDEYLDGVAAEALVRLFPSEVFLTEPRKHAGKYALSEHVYDALILAVYEAEPAHERDEDCARFVDGCCVECGASHGVPDGVAAGEEYDASVYDESHATCACGGRAFHREGCPELSS